MSFKKCTIVKNPTFDQLIAQQGYTKVNTMQGEQYCFLYKNKQGNPDGMMCLSKSKLEPVIYSHQACWTRSGNITCGLPADNDNDAIKNCNNSVKNIWG